MQKNVCSVLNYMHWWSEKNRKHVFDLFWNKHLENGLTTQACWCDSPFKTPIGHEWTCYYASRFSTFSAEKVTCCIFSAFLCCRWICSASLWRREPFECIVSSCKTDPCVAFFLFVVVFVTQNLILQTTKKCIEKRIVAYVCAHKMQSVSSKICTSNAHHTYRCSCMQPCKTEKHLKPHDKRQTSTFISSRSLAASLSALFRCSCSNEFWSRRRSISRCSEAILVSSHLFLSHTVLYCRSSSLHNIVIWA